LSRERGGERLHGGEEHEELRLRCPEARNVLGRQDARRTIPELVARSPELDPAAAEVRQQLDGGHSATPPPSARGGPARERQRRPKLPARRRCGRGQIRGGWLRPGGIWQ